MAYENATNTRLFTVSEVFQAENSFYVFINKSNYVG